MIARDPVYDALGRMISSRTRYDSDVNADTETLRYYYDGQNVFQEYDGSGATFSAVLRPRNEFCR